MSTKSVAKKLLIKDDYVILLLNEPEDYGETLGEIPETVSISTELDGKVDLIQVFITSKNELEKQLPELKPILKPKGLLWVTYPKRTSKMKADINRDIIRKFSQTIGLKAVAIISIDKVWSALRLKLE